MTFSLVTRSEVGWTANLRPFPNRIISLWVRQTDGLLTNHRKNQDGWANFDVAGDTSPAVQDSNIFSCDRCPELVVEPRSWASSMARCTVLEVSLRSTLNWGYSCSVFCYSSRGWVNLLPRPNIFSCTESPEFAVVPCFWTILLDRCTGLIEPGPFPEKGTLWSVFCMSTQGRNCVWAIPSLKFHSP